LRFVARAYHKATDVDPPKITYRPAIIAAATDNDGRVRGVQRTFLTDDLAAKADVRKPKMALGVKKTVAIRFAPAAETTMLSEGVENAMTAAIAMDMRLPAWASAGADSLRHVEFPDVVKVVLLVADADPAGRQGALKAARALTAKGKRVLIVRPPAAFKDVNDMVMDKGGRALEGEALSEAHSAVRRVIEGAAPYTPEAELVSAGDGSCPSCPPCPGVSNQPEAEKKSSSSYEALLTRIGELDSSDEAGVRLILAGAIKGGLSGFQIEMLIKALHEAIGVGLRILRKLHAELRTEAAAAAKPTPEERERFEREVEEQRKRDADEERPIAKSPTLLAEIRTGGPNASECP
jgi:hypothetical protein